MASIDNQYNTALEDALDKEIVDEYLSLQSVYVCGVNPKEIYGSSSFSSVFNKNITPDNFVTIVIQKGNSINSRIDNNIVMNLFSKEDQFSLPTKSSFSSPLSSKGDGAITGSLGKTGAAVANAVNPAMQGTTGVSLFNKLAYLPTWNGTDPVQINLQCILYATSNPLSQVQTPIDLLQRFVLPMSLNSYEVAGPGPTLNQNAVQDFLASMTKNINGGSKQLGLDNYNFSSLFTGSDMMSLQLGSMALISPVILTGMSITIPNRLTPFTITSQPNGKNQNLGSKTLMVPNYAEVSLSFMTYFPLVYNGSYDYDSLKLFPKSSYNENSSSGSFWNNLRNQTK